VDGFIAHEVQAIVPEAITGEKDAVDDDNNPVYQGIDQSKLVPLLTAALQEAGLTRSCCSNQRGSPLHPALVTEAHDSYQAKHQETQLYVANPGMKRL
jgi:hypothetical protein